jgi:diacylglycerol kinase family enzyme
VPIPAFVNPASGSASAATQALRAAHGFDVQYVRGKRLREAVHDAVRRGAERVLVAGGDGTLAAAASVLVRTPTALAVLPSGTLNHFARDHAIPTDAGAALELAAGGAVQSVDVGYVNDCAFINTSSVGAYVRFVYLRDRIEPYLGYRAATVVAGIRTLASLRRVPLRLDVGGEMRAYEAPLLFVSVGERDLRPAHLGTRSPEGARTLQIVVPRGHRQARRFSRAYARAGRLHAPASVTEEFGLDTVLTDRFRVELPGRADAGIAVDGEVRRMAVPLEYRLERGALRVVGPSQR